MSSNSTSDDEPEFAIQVFGLNKLYQIYDKPIDRLKQSICPRIQRIFGFEPKLYHDEFWALKDIGFSIKKGETFGIIGRNGAGKSTLLQVICGTLTPTMGKVETNGRVAALLELGSGFNPEFTGVENIYLYASIIGLTREETDARYEDIISFADIGDFIHQPIKTYSSGMTVRLAFAVIAHVDADILVIDEALAVGDAIFTQKCMRFIRAFKENGTLLFVSHDSGSITSLCSSCIWLENGAIRQIGSAKQIAQAYTKDNLESIYGSAVDLQEINGNLEANEADVPEDEVEVDEDKAAIDYGGELEVIDNLQSATGFRTGKAELVELKIVNLDSKDQAVLKGGEQVQVIVKARALTDLDQPILGFTVNDKLGQMLFGENTLLYTKNNPRTFKEGQVFEAKFTFRMPMLPNGDYAMFASVANGTLYDHIQHHLLHDALIIKISSSVVRWGLVGIWFDDIEYEICA